MLILLMHLGMGIPFIPIHELPTVSARYVKDQKHVLLNGLGIVTSGTFLHGACYYSFSRDSAIFVISKPYRQSFLLSIKSSSICKISLVSSSFWESMIMFSKYSYIKLEYATNHGLGSVAFYIGTNISRAECDQTKTKELFSKLVSYYPNLY